MVKRRRGTVIVVSSTAGFQPLPGNGTYSASKAFALVHAEALAAEVAPYGVTVTAVAPGLVETEFVETRSRVRAPRAKVSVDRSETRRGRRAARSGARPAVRHPGRRRDQGGSRPEPGDPDRDYDARRTVSDARPTSSPSVEQPVAQPLPRRVQLRTQERVCRRSQSQTPQLRRTAGVTATCSPTTDCASGLPLRLITALEEELDTGAADAEDGWWFVEVVIAGPADQGPAPVHLIPTRADKPAYARLLLQRTASPAPGPHPRDYLPLIQAIR